MQRTLACIVIASAGLGASAWGQLVPPQAVPGKEYSHDLDHDVLGIPAPGQVLAWDGLGGAANGVLLPSQEVDAIAHGLDAYFDDVVNDQAALVLSFARRTTAGIDVDVFGAGALAPLWYSESSPFGSGRGVWANAPTVNAAVPPRNLDGVELWGPSNDTTHWSDRGDLGGAAIRTAAGTYLSSAALGIALVGTPGAGLELDLDGLMVDDRDGDRDSFGIGDRVLISVRAQPAFGFDGGELWVLTRLAAGGINASFLVHGGVTWDTANPVGALFGHGVEEIDGIEAIIPTPGGLLLLGMGGLLIGRRRRA